MRFLIDGSVARVRLRESQWREGVGGQLLTPLTNYAWAQPRPFGIDNGSFGKFSQKRFLALLARMRAHRSSCLFVAAPDVVGDAIQTDKKWELWGPWIRQLGWVPAYVAQDGCKIIPKDAGAMFLGGTTEFKESEAAHLLVRQALGRGLHVHIGRVNTSARFRMFDALGAHTCDGSGVSRYDHMWNRLKDTWRDNKAEHTNPT